MKRDLLADIEKFMKAHGIGSYRFGILAVRNGRLVERLRAGRRIWPETEQQIHDFMRAHSTSEPAS